MTSAREGWVVGFRLSVRAWGKAAREDAVVAGGAGGVDRVIGGHEPQLRIRVKGGVEAKAAREDAVVAGGAGGVDRVIGGHEPQLRTRVKGGVGSGFKV